MSLQQHPNRKNKRVLGVAQIIGSNTEGKIFNLSHDGVGFLIHSHFERFTIGHTYTLMLKFESSEEFPEGIAVTLVGIVRHKELDRNNHCAKIGIEFNSITKETYQTIDRLVDFLEQANLFWGID